MKKNKLLLLFAVLIAGCTTANTSQIPNPTVTPTSNSNSPTVTSSPSSGTIVSASPTPVTSATPSAMPSNDPYKLSDSGLIKLNSAYIDIPETAFLVNDTFNMRMDFKLEALPSKDTMFSIFSLFDNATNDKKVHFSLSLDSNKNLILKAENASGLLDTKIPLPSIEAYKDYQLIFSRLKDKIEITLNGVKISSNDFKGNDFVNLEGKRKLHIGADNKGQNRIYATIDSINITDTAFYDFNNDLTDTYKYGLNALVQSGSFEYINKPIPSTPTPIASITPIPTPTPEVSSSPVPDKNVYDTSGTITVDLGVYNSNNNTQFVECQNKREKALKDNPNLNIDCYDETGSYTTPGFDLSTSKFINSERGDMRFITDIIRDADGVNSSRIIIAGSDVTPKVNVIDLGLKTFDGLTGSDLRDRVDYNLSNRLYSSSTISSPVIIDHVYAVRTYRYGSEPRYAKVLINDIITDDYQFIPLKDPQVITSAQYISYSGKSNFSPTKSYSYYISTFDGIGETSVNSVGQVNADPSADVKVVKMEVRVPYGAKGYSLYRKDNSTSQIYKIGPILSKVDETIEIIDKGDKGYLVDSLPTTSNTVKNGFKPGRGSKPIKVTFTYRFDGDMDFSF